MSAQSHTRTKVFISYSHRDAEWLQRLRVHLKPLERERRIEIWDDTRIQSGSKWREEIRRAIAATKVAVLLVSADFLASDFIAADELPPLLSAAEEEGAAILPVILSPSRFERTSSLAQFQSVNNPSKPLIGLSRVEQEAVLVKVGETIEASLNHSSETATEHRQEGGELQGPTIGETGEQSRAETNSPSWLGRTTSSWLRPAIWVAIVGGIAALITAYWQFVYKPAHSDEVVQYSGRVSDQSSQRAIRGAKVSVETQGVPQIYYTDSDGIFNVRLRSSADAIHICVEAEGYESFDRNTSLSRNMIEDVRLTPLSLHPQPSQAVTNSTPASENENSSPSATNSTARRRPRVNNASDLEERKRRAREDLNYRSSNSDP